MKPVHNPRFRFRQREIQQIHNKLKLGDSLLITGLRRIGKSWLLKQALYELTQKADGFDARYLDVQWFNTPAQLLKNIISELPRESHNALLNYFDTIQAPANTAARWLRENVKSLTLGGMSIELTSEQEQDWKALAEELTKAFDSSQKTFVIALDEMPFFLENILKNGYTPP